jgi:2-polyprenyl-3-methyl-5-hydroxy-6-metoxy-1,4-benzoquinol methylase
MLPFDGLATGGFDAMGVRFEIDLEVLSGAVGLSAAGRLADSPVSQEIVQQVAGRRTIQLDAEGDASRLRIRSGAEGAAQLRLHRVRPHVRRRFDITELVDELMPVLLRAPGRPALEAVAASLSRRLRRHVIADEIGALECARAPIRMPANPLFTDELGHVIDEETDRLIGLLGTYDPAKMDPRNGYLGRKFFATYLRQSTIRVYHLIRQLRDFGLTSGSILEVGSLFGQFALPLQRLGYQVTVVDRYRAYDGALDGYTSSLRNAGVNVVETDRTDEAALLAGLGRFDAVVCMAVIEHIPHTPRELLRTLVSHGRPGGVLALDTPNIARFWNRKKLSQGLSIHQAIENQFLCEIPYEGHHREYTADEMVWMLEQVGCRDIRATLFDYNLLQFADLSSEHLEVLLAMTVDPMLADTVLVAGLIDGNQEPSAHRAI